MGRAMSYVSAVAGTASAKDSRDASSATRSAAAIVSVLSAMVLVVLDAATVNVALPSVAKSLHVTAGSAVAVVTSYQLGLVMALLPTAAFGESLGYRRVFKAGVIVFAVASVGCSLSPSLPWLIAARFVQGLGGAAVMSLGVALLRRVVAPSRFGAAVGWNALAVALASAAGPALGSFVLSVSSWEWIFAATRPLALVVLLTSCALPDEAGNGRSVDLFSVTLNAMTFGGLVIACELSPSHPVMSGVLFAVAAASLAALVRREHSRETPLIPLDLLRSASFRVSVTASVICFAGQTAGLIALPFYFQQGFHLNTLMTGLFIAPWPLATALMAPVAGRLADRFPGAFLCATGNASRRRSGGNGPLACVKPVHVAALRDAVRRRLRAVQCIEQPQHVYVGAIRAKRGGGRHARHRAADGTDDRRDDADDAVRDPPGERCTADRHDSRRRAHIACRCRQHLSSTLPLTQARLKLP